MRQKFHSKSMNKLSIIFAPLLIVFFYSCNQKNKATDIEKKKESTVVAIKDRAEKIPPEKPNKVEVKHLAENIKDFVPENYMVLDTVSGDLNLDDYNDMIMVLKKNDEEKTSDVIDNPEKRPLLILIGELNNKYKLAERNDNSVYCVDCGGMMGDPYMRTVIKKGYFSVEHYGGSGSRWSRITTYKYSKEKNNWFLHKDGGENFNVSDLDKIEKWIRTTKDFGIVPFKDFNIYKEEKEE